MSIDLLIVGGQVIDGTGRPPYRADVAVRDSKIDDIGIIEPPQGIPTLDATGLVVTPGFIDIHSHSDFTLVVDPRAVSALTQGVTLEVVGNCGHGCAPMADPALVKANLYGYQDGYPFTWNTFAEYLDTLRVLQACAECRGFGSEWQSASRVCRTHWPLFYSRRVTADEQAPRPELGRGCLRLFDWARVQH